MTDIVKDGYVVASGIFSPENLMELELEAKNILGVEDVDYPLSVAVTDAVNRSASLAKFIVHPSLLGTLLAELGEDFMFLQHCDLVANQSTGLIRHSVDRNEDQTGKCWDIQPTYGVVRACMFTGQEQISIIPDSHLLPGKDPKKAVDIVVEAGSVFIHDARLYTALPDPIAPRYGLLAFYGIPNEHSKRHYEFITKQRKDLRYLPPNPKLYRLLGASGILYRD
jgi:hypothetical protein